MNALVRRMLGEDKFKGDYPEDETRTYTITCWPEHLDQLEKLFSWMNMTRGGHSGAAEIYIDGDGAARVEIKKKDGELPKHDEEARCDGKVEFKVCLESKP